MQLYITHFFTHMRCIFILSHDEYTRGFRFYIILNTQVIEDCLNVYKYMCVYVCVRELFLFLIKRQLSLQYNNTIKLYVYIRRVYVNII